MEKIPSLIVNGQIDPTYDWLFTPTTRATQMVDGLCYAVIDGKPYSHLSSSGKLTQDVIVCGIVDGLVWGWQPVPEDDVLFWQVWKEYDEYHFNWSYELVGPSINKNPEDSPNHVLMAHGTEIIRNVEPEIESIKAYLKTHNTEGIVFWEDPDDLTCRKVKVQQKDFGFPRRRKTAREKQSY